MRTSRNPNQSRLWSARQRAVLGQKSVSRLMGSKNHSSLSLYESGRQIPNLRTALKLSVIYETPLEELYAPLLEEVEREVEVEREKMPWLRKKAVREKMPQVFNQTPAYS